MEVRMIQEVLSPCMQNGGEADPGSKVPRIGGDGDERVGDGSKENVIDHSFVLERDRGYHIRQSPYDVIILHRQKFGTTCSQPSGIIERLTFGAVPVTTRVV